MHEMRTSALSLVGAALRIYLKNFRRFFVFSAVFGSLAVMGQRLLMQPMDGAIADFVENIGSLANADIESAQVQNYIERFWTTIAPHLPWFALFMVSGWLLLQGLLSGGITRLTDNILNNRTLPRATDSVYNEMPRALKWYVVALANLFLLLIIIALLTVFSVIFVIAVPTLGLFVMMFGLLFILAIVPLMLSMLYIITLRDGLQGALRTALILYRRRRGLVFTTGLWIAVLQWGTISLGSALGSNFNTAGGMAVALFMSAFFAPIPLIVAALLYKELRGTAEREV